MTQARRVEVREYFRCRPCFVCGGLTFCQHRQLEIALAELDWISEHRPEASQPKPMELEKHSAIHEVRAETERPANGYGWKSGPYTKRSANA